jgi:hypothetical protein
MFHTGINGIDIFTPDSWVWPIDNDTDNESVNTNHTRHDNNGNILHYGTRCRIPGAQYSPRPPCSHLYSSSDMLKRESDVVLAQSEERGGDPTTALLSSEGARSRSHLIQALAETERERERVTSRKIEIWDPISRLIPSHTDSDGYRFCLHRMDIIRRVISTAAPQLRDRPLS